MACGQWTFLRLLKGRARPRYRSLYLRRKRTRCIAGPTRGCETPQQTEGENIVSTKEPLTYKPVLLAVDDDPDALGKIKHELRERYGGYYRVACEGSPETSLRALRDLKAAGEEVAVVLADQWMMPGMPGTQFLTYPHQLYPGAKRAPRPLARRTATTRREVEVGYPKKPPTLQSNTY
jgi:CheY-like chemotaxis protein